MKKLLLILLCLPMIGLGQGWEQTFSVSPESDDVGYSVQQTLDGGYVTLGHTLENNNRDILLIKTNNNGEQQWTKILGGEESDYGLEIQETSDLGFIIIGYTKSFNFLDAYEVYLIKTDQNGNEQWSHTYSANNSLSNYGYSVDQTNDGGYIIVGEANDFISSNFTTQKDILLIKTDENGNLVWNTILDEYNGLDQYDQVGHSVKQTSDGGYIISGYEFSWDDNIWDLLLTKIDGSGNQIWQKIIDGGGYEEGLSVIQTSEGGYAVCGFTTSYGNGSQDILLVKTDAYGNEEWINFYGGVSSEKGHSVIQTEDGGYILAGYTYSFGNGNSDVYVVKTNENGTEQWTKTFVDEASNQAYSIQQTNDCGYIIAGKKENLGDANNDVLLIKFDSYGNINPYEASLTVCDSINNLIANTTIIESGVYTDTLTNFCGGDSIVIYDITINNSPQIITIEGNSNAFNLTEESYQISNITTNSFEWNVEGGIIIQNDDTLIQVEWGNQEIGYVEIIQQNPENGCISISLLEINLSPPTYEFYFSGCDSVQNIVDNTYFFESGVHIDTLVNIFGIDSVIIQNIDVYLSPELIQINGNSMVYNSSLEFYQITNDTDNILEWDITGGSIYENQNNIIQVLWGNEGVGYVEVTETDTNGCSTTSILEVIISNATSITDLNNSNKKLRKITNLIGQETPIRKNTPMFYIYDDGTVKKKLIIE